MLLTEERKNVQKALCINISSSEKFIIFSEICLPIPRTAGVHLNFRAGSTFPVSWFVLYRLAGVNKVGLALCTGQAGAARLTRSDFTLL